VDLQSRWAKTHYPTRDRRLRIIDHANKRQDLVFQNLYFKFMLANHHANLRRAGQYIDAEAANILRPTWRSYTPG